MTTKARPRHLDSLRRELGTHVHAYAQAVVDGKVLAGRLVRLACERHLRDLERQEETGLRFDPERAGAAIQFFQFLRLAEGEHAGRPFVLQPWQEFIVGSLFGWLGPDKLRRFRQAYIEVGKGNGKSPMAAAIGLYCLVADGEPGAEVYCAAVTREQASISFRDAMLMVEASPDLAKRLSVLKNNIAYPAANSFMRPVSSEHRGLDGKRVHCALIDEIHEHPTDIVVEKMRAGTKGRRQALIVEITNSGYDRESICYRHHAYSQQVLEGAVANDAWFAYVCGLDSCASCLAAGHDMPQDGCADCDDWRDPEVWIKANPNLGVSITAKYLQEQVAEAIGMPAKQNIVKRLNFCIWTQSVTRWIAADSWSACAVPPPAPLAGRACYAGLDLADTDDITALTLYFPNADGSDGGDVLSWFWVPEETVLERERRTGVPYSAWVRDGFLTATEGNRVDYGYIERTLAELAQLYDIREVAMDPWNATQTMTNLQAAGFTIVPVRQGFLSLSAPSKELDRLIASRALRHDGNPVLAWMASNVVVSHDPAGNIKPDKAKSTEKIDGIVALVMAIDRATRAQDNGVSQYEHEDLFFI